MEAVMGIPMSVDIRDAGEHTSAAQAAFAVLREADARFSTYRADSEVSAANRGEVTESEYSDDLRAVIRIGEDAGRASAGAFRIRTPDGAFSLDGVVKGWAAARAADALRAAGLRDFCLNAGGDIVVSGSPGGGKPWNVGVRSPAHPNAMLAVLAVVDGAVATSGSYERGQHIVDGRTGEPARGLASVTVVADDLTRADVLATSVFALGADGVGWALRHGARGVLALAEDGAILAEGVLAFARSAE
jgi:thiamine biosynthesis lipoprotein